MAISNIQDIIDAGTGGNTGGQSVLGATEDTQVDTALDSLSDTQALGATQLEAQPDFVLPETKPDTEAAGMDGFLEEQADTFTAQLEKQAETTEKGAVDSLEDFVSSLETREGFEGFSLAAEEEAGVSQLESELLDINDQIRRERLSMRRSIERIQEKGGGLKIGAAAEIGNIQRVSLSKQADLAIVQLAAQGRFDSAKAIADRKARVQFEQEENRIEASRFLYQENKSLFTQAEQRLFETRLSDRDRSLKNERADFETLQGVKLSALQMAQTNNAPVSILSAIQQAETPEEVLQAGGKYGSVDLLDRAIKSQELAKLRSTPEVLAPTSVIDQGGRKLLINTQTGEVIKDFGVSDVSVGEMTQAITEQKILQLDDLKAHKGMRKAVGVDIPFLPDVTRFTPLRRDVITGEVSDFIAGIDQLTKDLTRQKLGEAKAQGITFGALSEKELSLIADAATKINAWRVEKDGKTTHYSAAEKDFTIELDLITNFAKLDAVLKGAVPSSVGVVETNDGFWVKNGDGSLEQIRKK